MLILLVPSSPAEGMFMVLQHTRLEIEIGGPEPGGAELCPPFKCDNLHFSKDAPFFR